MIYVILAYKVCTNMILYTFLKFYIFTKDKNNRIVFLNSQNEWLIL
jgi:hypothetical protein